MIETILNTIGAGIMVVIIAIGSWFGLYPEQPPVDLSPLQEIEEQVETMTKYVKWLTIEVERLQEEQYQLGTQIPKVYAVFETSLATKITASSTSFVLVKGTDEHGTALSGFIGFVINEGLSNEEFVTADCVATACTFSQRGVDVVTGNTEVYAKKQAHRRGSSVKVTNHPVLAVITRIMNGDETFPNLLSYASYPTPVEDEDIVAKKYVDDIAIAGSPAMTTTTAGIAELANTDELLTVVSYGATGKILLMPKFYFATSSYARGATTTAVITDTDGKIDQSFIDKTETWSWSGEHTFTTTTVSTSTISDLTIDEELRVTGTSTFSASSTFSHLPSFPSDPVYDNDGVRKSYVTSNYLGIFGDGAYGDYTLTNATSLTADCYFEDLTINANATMTTAGYRIYVSGTLTNNGTIANNGGNGSQPTAGTAGGGVTVRGGGVGGAGSTISGGGGGGAGTIFIAAKTIDNTNGTIEANGGNGGNGTTGAGDATGSGGTGISASKGGSGGNGGKCNQGPAIGGTATASTMEFENFYVGAPTFDPVIGAGIGAGGGGGGGSQEDAASAGMGGGGGGGGWILLYYSTATWGTEQCLGGSTGSNGASCGGATYVAPQNGSTGTITKIDIDN